MGIPASPNPKGRTRTPARRLRASVSLTASVGDSGTGRGSKDSGRAAGGFWAGIDAPSRMVTMSDGNIPLCDPAGFDSLFARFEHHYKRVSAMLTIRGCDAGS